MLPMIVKVRQNRDPMATQQSGVSVEQTGDGWYRSP